ncbi:TetR/AcrR family transcriptional regulator [Streptomyces sp. NPDC050504]|uniref:TetR/AcrR family transcriptional regulator n=1 Tax=Streptomyces sp. NPDC050504 TaxID=3365618 RepID=UPI0037AAC7C9
MSDRTVRLLWGPQPTPARGPKRTLDLDRIARAGVEVADAEGLAELSMQQVAARLGVTKMALYRYVPGKAELVALMVDAAVGEYPEGGGFGGEGGPGGKGGSSSEGAASGAGWREALGEWGRQLFAVFGRHPWLLDATIGPRVMGPCELAWTERAVAALDGTGLSGAERMDAVVLLVGHVRGITQQGRAVGAGDSPEEQFGAVLGPLLREHGERFPALAAVFGEAAGANAEEGGAGSAGSAVQRDQAWEFGLERILDGLAVLIEGRRSR